MSESKRVIDFSRTTSHYSTSRPPYPPQLFEELSRRGVILADTEVVDLGTGTGVMARELSRRGCRVTGIDPSEKLLEEARCRESASEIVYLCGKAEETELPGGHFHAAVAAQCWHWLDSLAAANEVLRILTPGGLLAIVHFDWLDIPGNVIHKTEPVIARYLSGELPWRTIGGAAGIYRHWLLDLAVAGFEQIESFSFDISLKFERQEDWENRLAASTVAASLDDEAFNEFLQDVRVQIANLCWPQSIPHRVFCVLGMKPR